MKILIIKTVDDYVFSTFFTPANMELVKKNADVVIYEYSDDTKDELKREIADANAVVAFWGITGRLDEEVLSCAKKLELVAYCGGSAVPVMSDAIKSRGIKILSGNRYFAESVAEGTLAYMFLGQRKIYKTLKEMEFKGWKQAYDPTAGLRYKTIGIYGFGMIAKNLANMLKAFETKVKVSAEYDIPPEVQKEYGVEQCSIEELFSTSDIISINAGMSEENYHIVDKRLLSMMKDGALIVNTSRGAIINEKDLEDEVITGRIRAVLDVYETHPLPMESRLRGLENVTLIPYRGGPTTDVREYVAAGLVEDIISYFSGGEVENEVSYDYIKHQTVESIAYKNKK